MTGGIYDNSPENIVVLSIEDHAQAHKELYERFGKIQDLKAYKMLLGESESDVMNSLEYRKKLSEAGKGNKRRLGKHHTEETKNKISKSTKGKKQKLRSEETKKKISLSHLGKKRKPFTEETKEKMRKAQLGNKNGSGNKGKPLSEQTKEKMRKSKRHSYESSTN
jgi:protein-arginine kinase